MIDKYYVRRIFMFRVRTQLGLNSSYQAESYYRSVHPKRVVIGVLDSGVSYHPDLQHALLAFRDFSGHVTRDGRRYRIHTPYDDYGHGTHVCGILCGNGGMSDGRYAGVFPGGGLVVGKVLDERGEGRAEDMLEGLAWILNQKDRYGIRILNISVGISKLREKEKLKKLQDLLRNISREGILVVCAAGNQGPADGTLSALGELPEVISVGCNDGPYYRGDPRRCERYCGRGRSRAVLRKPDIVAPGTCIISCSKNYEKGGQYAYEERSGTSMSAPIVSGCLGRALQICPELTSVQLKGLLTSSARDLGEPWNKQGWGMLQPKKLEGLANKMLSKEISEKKRNSLTHFV